MSDFTLYDYIYIYIYMCVCVYVCMYVYYAQQCRSVSYAMTLQCPHARNLNLRDDYIDLETNNQFDAYSLNVSCEIFAGNRQ